MDRRSFRHHISVLLLCIITYQSVGTVVLYGAWMLDAKRSMRRTLMQSIPAEQLTTFTFRSGDPFIGRDRHEFEWQGTMYDVVRTIRHGDSITVQAMKDTRESEVRRSLVESVARRSEHDPSTQRTNHYLAEMMDLRYLQPPVAGTGLVHTAFRHAPLTEREPLPPLRCIEVPPPEPSSFHS